MRLIQPRTSFGKRLKHARGVRVCSTRQATPGTSASLTMPRIASTGTLEGKNFGAGVVDAQVGFLQRTPPFDWNARCLPPFPNLADVPHRP